jgi:hypothetical protein
VQGPAGVIRTGETASYSVQIDLKGLHLDPQYGCSVSARKILNGQGTTSIDVRQPDEALTVTVKVKGLPSNCPDTASETAITDPPPQGVELDEFTGPISQVDKSRFDRINSVLRENPNDQLYIFVGCQKGDEDNTKLAREEIVKHLDPFKDEDPSRITFVNIECSRDFIQFWLVPPGAESPRCNGCEELSRRSSAEKCPSISVDGPVGYTPYGRPMVFTGLVSDEGRKFETSYNWAVHGGKIVDGQGTLSVTSIQTDKDGSLTLTLTVGGLPKGCFDNASTTAPICDCVDPTQIDEYGPISIGQEYARLRAAASKLKEHPNDALFLIRYPGKSRREFNQRIRLVRQYASSVLHLENPKFKIITGPNIGRDTTKIYTVPPGAEEPVP